jgi:hypothetical protein
MTSIHKSGGAVIHFSPVVCERFFRFADHFVILLEADAPFFPFGVGFGGRFDSRGHDILRKLRLPEKISYSENVKRSQRGMVIPQL